MSLPTRLMIYGLIVVFLPHVMADCYMPNSNESRYCPTPHVTVFRCESTVYCKYDPDQCETYDTYNYNMKINLYDSDVRPFRFGTWDAYFIELNIYSGYLITIPENVYNMTRLTNFKISQNKLRKINLNNFLTLPELKEIDLSDNKIIVIETNEHGSGNSNVQVIELSYNSINHVPNNFIRRFNELVLLNMSHNLISSIDKHAFEGAVQLQTLDLSYNKLYNVENVFTQLPKPYDANYATSENLQKLSKLVLDNNFIANINFTGFFDTGIPELSIGENKISCNEMARVKYSKYSDKFDRIVTAVTLNFDIQNINGIPCREAKYDNTKIMVVSDNLDTNILISSLKNAVENNSKSVNNILDILYRQNMSEINNELSEIKNKIYPDYQPTESSAMSTMSMSYIDNNELSEIKNKIYPDYELSSTGATQTEMASTMMYEDIISTEVTQSVSMMYDYELSSTSEMASTMMYDYELRRHPHANRNSIYDDV